MFAASSFKLQLYAQCPQAYKFSYIDRLTAKYRKPKPYLTMGMHVHNSLKEFFQLTPPLRTAEKLEEILRRQWRKNRQGFDSTDQEALWGQKAIHMLKLFCSKADLSRTPVFLEDYYDRWVDPSLKILGRVDRVDEESDGLHVIDYKTGKPPTTKPDPLQLSLYAVIMQGKVEKPVVRASYLYLQNYQWQTFDITEELIQKSLEQVRADVTTVLADTTYTPKINPHCRRCDFLEICPVKPQIEILMERGQL